MATILQWKILIKLFFPPLRLTFVWFWSFISGDVSLSVLLDLILFEWMIRLTFFCWMKVIKHDYATSPALRRTNTAFSCAPIRTKSLRESTRKEHVNFDWFGWWWVVKVNWIKSAPLKRNLERAQPAVNPDDMNETGSRRFDSIRRCVVTKCQLICIFHRCVAASSFAIRSIKNGSTSWSWGMVNAHLQQTKFKWNRS